MYRQQKIKNMGMPKFSCKHETTFKQFLVTNIRAVGLTPNLCSGTDNTSPYILGYVRYRARPLVYPEFLMFYTEQAAVKLSPIEIHYALLLTHNLQHKGM